MFKKGNKLYADAGKYLVRKDKRKYAFTVINESEDNYDELDLNNPLDLEINGNIIKYQNGCFSFIIDKKDYASIKKSIIKSRYSNDDQLAIMLNKDNSEEDAILYNKMQEWRDWAGNLAKQIEKI